MDILSSQKDVVRRLINLDHPASAELSPDQTWKVLVYDEYCQNILSTLLNVADLRALGVTLWMNIKQSRQRVPDAPAVYFVLPSQENVEKIAQDCAANLYDKFYLNFASAIPQKLLELLARRTAESRSAHLIEKVFDQYANFVSLESKIFSLNIAGSYANLHALNDQVVLDAVDSIVDGLFAVCVTLGQIPVIRARPGEAAEMVARKLDEKIRNHRKEKNNLFSINASMSMNLQRPVLVLLDRNADLSVTVHHPWTYQALLHDLMDMNANRVNFKLAENEEKGNPKNFSYDLDILNDSFWRNNAGLPFSKVAENVEVELQEYKKAEEQISRGRHDTSEDMLKSMTQGLSSAIDSLPELQKKKRQAEMHVNIATALMKLLTERSIDAFFSLEERMIAGGAVPDKSVILEAIDVNAKGTPSDKLRLFIIYYLRTNSGSARSRLTKEELVEFKERLEAARADTSVLDYIQKLHLITAMNADPSVQNIGNENSSASLFESIANKAIGSGIEWLAGNVKNLLPLKSDLPVTSIVKELMANSSASPQTSSAQVSEVNNVGKYLYFDPRSDVPNPPRNRTPFKEAIVFVVGGGNYVEYQNLQDFSIRSKAPSTRSVIYGSSELMSPERFLQQFSKCAKG